MESDLYNSQSWIPHGDGWCQEYVSTLTARDGIKTSTRTPNGQDAFDGKLVVAVVDDVENTVWTSPNFTVVMCDPLASNAMKSNNPDSGFHVIDVAACIDTSNQSPSRNQGGMIVVKES